MIFDTNKIIEKMNINSSKIYNIPMLKPFIDNYYLNKNNTKYTLFNAYIFQYNRLEELYKEYEWIDDSYFLKNGHLNLKLKKVRNTFIKNNVVYFIGNIYNNEPIFLRLTYFGEDNTYDFCGYMIGSSDFNYSYLTSDCKKLNFKLKNIPINNLYRQEWDSYEQKTVNTSLFNLSEKTKTTIEKTVRI